MSLINLSSTTPAAPAGNTNVTWQTDASNDISGYVPDSVTPLTTEGDLLVYAGGSPPGGPVRLPVGSNGDVLTADSTSVNGVSWQPGSGGGGVGTATFTVPGGVITGLVVSGLITNVTRSSTGVYVVTLSGASAGYAIQAIGGSSTVSVTLQLNPASSYTTGGFTITAVANVASLVDPDFVSISVFST